MRSVTIDEAKKLDLSEITSVVQVLDQQGNRVGFFAPVADPDWKVMLHILATVDPEELRNRDPEAEGGRPLREILKDLQERESRECATR